MIKMVISPEYFGRNDSERDIKNQLKVLGAHNVAIDEGTGFVTALMTVDNYEAFVESLKARINDTAERLKKKYDGIVDISCNGDYTAFNIVIDKLTENQKKNTVIDLLMVSATYQVISGIPQNEAAIKVRFLDKDKKLIKCVNTAERKMI